MLKNLLFQLFFCVFYIGWLILCFFISLPGFFLRSEKEKMSVRKVIESETICRILVRKKKISKANYEFEATQVSQFYDRHTFSGYMFIVEPVIWALHKNKAMDDIVTFFVRRWIRVQKYKILQAGSPAPTLHNLISEICVKIASSLGRFLSLFGN